MLKRIARLRRDSDIKLVLKKGAFRSGKLAKVFLLPKNNLNHWRLATVVSRKVASRATIRNRYRRWLKIIVKDLFKQQSADSDSCDMVIIARPQALKEATFAEMEAEVSGLLRELILANRKKND